MSGHAAERLRDATSARRPLRVSCAPIGLFVVFAAGAVSSSSRAVLGIGIFDSQLRRVKPARWLHRADRVPDRARPLQRAVRGAARLLTRSTTRGHRSCSQMVQCGARRRSGARRCMATFPIAELDRGRGHRRRVDLDRGLHSSRRHRTAASCCVGASGRRIDGANSRRSDLAVPRVLARRRPPRPGSGMICGSADSPTADVSSESLAGVRSAHRGRPARPWRSSTSACSRWSAPELA